MQESIEFRQNGILWTVPNSVGKKKMRGVERGRGLRPKWLTKGKWLVQPNFFKNFEKKGFALFEKFEKKGC